MLLKQVPHSPLDQEPNTGGENALVRSETGFTKEYPSVSSNMAGNGKSPMKMEVSMGKSFRMNGPFSIATFNYWRVLDIFGVTMDF